MRTILILVLLFLNSQILKAQLISGPLEFNTFVTGEFADNFKGGFNQGHTYYGLEQFTLNFNTEIAHLWKGGNLFIHAINIHGEGPTKKFVGDLMYLSNIEANDFTGLYQIWYSQDIGKVKILLGQHDMNSEFAGTKYGENFINSSYGVVSNILLNVPVSIYPVAAPCILIKYSYNDQLILKLATYDGNPGTLENNFYAGNWHIDKAEGFMSLAELQYKNIQFIQNGITTSHGIQMGIYKLGLFYHSGYFSNYADTVRLKKGNYGIYFIADQMIVPKPSNPAEGLALMLEVGLSPAKYNLIEYSLEGGVRYHGILPKRMKDFAGFAITYASVSRYFIYDYPNHLHHETSFEISYKFQFSKHFAIQPDFQFIIHPGLHNDVANARVGLIRLQLSL